MVLVRPYGFRWACPNRCDNWDKPEWRGLKHALAMKHTVGFNNRREAAVAYS